jgi:hypothetical protein
MLVGSLLLGMMGCEKTDEFGVKFWEGLATGRGPFMLEKSEHRPATVSRVKEDARAPGQTLRVSFRLDTGLVAFSTTKNSQGGGGWPDALHQRLMEGVVGRASLVECNASLTASILLLRYWRKAGLEPEGNSHRRANTREV